MSFEKYSADVGTMDKSVKDSYASDQHNKESIGDILNYKNKQIMKTLKRKYLLNMR